MVVLVECESIILQKTNFSHFNVLKRATGKDIQIDLTKLVNNVQRLMSYDRKLKNAISKYVKELL